MERKIDANADASQWDEMGIAWLCEREMKKEGDGRWDSDTVLIVVV